MGFYVHSHKNGASPYHAFAEAVNETLWRVGRQWG